MYDIAIIGLGPAGATLARLLDKGLRVIALDKKRAAGDGGFHKPCGGLLAPDAQKALASFDLTLPLEVLVSPQIFNVRTIDLPSGCVRHYQRFYINLDRHRFDLWLKSLIPSHVEVYHDTTCQSIAFDGACYHVAYGCNGVTRTIRARQVVGADGANSKVRKLLYPEAAMRTYLSVQQWFDDRHASPFYSCVFDPETTDCYAWGLSKNEHFIFGGAFPVADGKARFHRLKEKLAPYGFHLDNPRKTEACLVLRPAGVRDCFPGRDGGFLIGEAAGLISPSSLEGISYAIRSAQCLSRVLSRGNPQPNRAYWRHLLPIKAKLIAKNLKSPFMYQPGLRELVMKSGVSSVSMHHEHP